MPVLRPRQATRTLYSLLRLVTKQFYRRSNQQQPLRDQQATVVLASEKKATSLPSHCLRAQPQAVGHLPPGWRRRLRSYRSWSHQASARNERRTKVRHFSSSSQRHRLWRLCLRALCLPDRAGRDPSCSTAVTPPLRWPLHAQSSPTSKASRDEDGDSYRRAGDESPPVRGTLVFEQGRATLHRRPSLDRDIRGDKANS